MLRKLFNTYVMQSRLSVGALALCTSFCARPEGVDVNSSYKTTSVNIGLPDTSVLKNQVADIATKMNGFHLVVTPAEAGCITPTSLTVVGEYKSSAVLSSSLQQGCSYNLTLSLGHRNSGNGQPALQPSSSSAVAWDPNIKGLIDRTCLKCHGAGKSHDFSTYEHTRDHGQHILQAVDANRMPPSAPLGAEEKALLKRWVDGGFAKINSAVQPSTQPPLIASTLDAVYFKNDAPLVVQRAAIQGQAAISVLLTVHLQDAGRAIGINSLPVSNPVTAQAATTSTSPTSSTATIKEVAITVANRGYQPSSLNLKANEPVRLRITRTEKDGCGEEIVFPAFNKRAALPLNEPVAIDITPTKPGQFSFTCGMAMYKGKIVVTQ